MIPVFATIAAGAREAGSFVRVYPFLTATAGLVYLTVTALWMLALSRSHFMHWTIGYAASSAAWLMMPVLLAPVWTALNRFVVLDDRSRRFFAWDFRVGRVLWVGLVLAVISASVGAALPLTLDLEPSLPAGKLIFLAILGSAALVRLVGWWLTARLAAAPALAAAGKRQHALDTSLAYTDGVALRLMFVKLFINLPWLVIVGAILPAAGHVLADQPALFVKPIAIAVVAMVFFCSEFVEAAAMATAAVRLVRARQPNHPRFNADIIQPQPAQR